MYIILIVIVIILFVFYDPIYKKFIETFTQVSTDEAIKNVASLYNTGKMDVSSANITGDVEIGGNLSVTGKVGSEKTTTSLLWDGGPGEYKTAAWNKTAQCPSGYYACGYQKKTEPQMAMGASNNLGERLICCPFK